MLDCACAMQPQGSGAIELQDTMSAFNRELSDGTWNLEIIAFEEASINSWCIRCGKKMMAECICCMRKLSWADMRLQCTSWVHAE